ncbi:MAG: FkbM family methyltransferase [Chitinophagaceae bacterium]|nr:FkbM family methyltransferase [Chitinophagaceae bacterium]
MDIKQTLSEFFRFVHRFGIIRGPFLFLKLKLGSQQNIRIPGIAYPFSLRKGSSDYETFYQAIVHNQYLFNYPLKPEVIIDGGANIGLASIAFKSMFPGATIIAIEPDKENFEQLNINLRPYNNIHTLNVGIWNKKAILKITDKYNYGKWGMITEEIEKNTIGSISSVTIDEIMQTFKLDKIDILKLDIETAERELFSSGYASWLPMVKVIVIELHDSISKGTAMPFFKAISETLNNYSYYQLGENTIIVNEAAINNK